MAHSWGRVQSEDRMERPTAVSVDRDLRSEERRERLSDGYEGGLVRPVMLVCGRLSVNEVLLQI